jgi:hypothetical protein
MSKALTGVEVQSHALVRALAQELNQSTEEVRDVYDRQFQRLESQARIKTYLPIFAARHTRRILANP